MKHQYRNGFTLIEVLVVGLLVTTGMIAMSSALSSYGKIQKTANARMNSKLAAVTTLRLLTHSGRLAESCTSSHFGSLECEVKMVPASATAISLSYTLAGNVLTYRRDNDIVWQKEVAGFIVCSANHIIAGSCPDGGATWSASTLPVAAPGFSNFFRVRIIANVSDGDQNVGHFPVQGGFFIRNQTPNTPHYAWSPVGGS